MIFSFLRHMGVLRPRCFKRDNNSCIDNLLMVLLIISTNKAMCNVNILINFSVYTIVQMFFLGANNLNYRADRVVIFGTDYT